MSDGHNPNLVALYHLSTGVDLNLGDFPQKEMKMAYEGPYQDEKVEEKPPVKKPSVKKTSKPTKKERPDAIG